MKQYKIVIAYDGTDYSGWFMQNDRPSIMQTLQNTFATVFDHKIKLLGASKTDAGVHALGQTAIFKTDLDLDLAKMLFAWNNQLPPDIVIRSLVEVDPSFHPHVSIAFKKYYYHFFLERPLPFVQRYGWYFHRSINKKKLQEALQMFVGTHDFRAFCTDEPADKNTVRTIDRIELEYIRRFGVYRIVVTGQRFLRHMIRRMVGAALTVASRKDVSIEKLEKVMKAKDPNNTLPTAPAKGLMLYKILYTHKEMK